MKLLVVCVALILISLTAILSRPGSGAQVIHLSHKEIDFGEVDSFTEPSKNLVVSNPNSDRARVRIIADCSCVSVNPIVFELKPGEKRTVELSLKKSGGLLVDGRRSVRRVIEVVSGVGSSIQRQSTTLTCLFNEPFSVDPSSVSLRTSVFSNRQCSIELSANLPALAPLLVAAPSFAKQPTVEWNDEFSAGRICFDIDQTRPLKSDDYSFVLKSSHLGNQIDIPYSLQVEPTVIFEPCVITLHEEQQSVEVKALAHADLPRACNFEIVEIGHCPRGVEAKLAGGLLTVASADGVAVDNSDQSYIEIRIAVTRPGHERILESVAIPVVNLF